MAFSSANDYLAQRDQALPGLAVLLDKDRVLEELNRAAERRTDVVVKDKGNFASYIELDYVRYKPGRRCIGLYRLSKGGDSEAWVGTAYTKPGWDNLSAKIDAAKRCQYDHSNLIEVSGCFIRFERFPIDRSLPTAAKLLNDSRSSKRIRRILKSTHQLDHNADTRLQVLAYKPARRLVLKVSCEDRALASIKCYTKQGYRRAVANQREFESMLGAFANPATGCDRYQTMTRNWIEGDCLSQMLASTNPQSLSSTLEQVGKRLAELHRQPIGERFNRTLPQAKKTCAMVSNLVADLIHLQPSLATPLSELTSELETLSSVTKHTLIHGDFYAKQVIVTKTGLRFLDFDDVQIGDPWIDVGNFVAKLHWNAFRGHFAQDLVRLYSTSFVRGYMANQRWNHEAFVRQLGEAMLRCTPHVFRQPLADWSTHMASWLEYCRQVIAETQSGNCCSSTSFKALNQESKPFPSIDRLNALLDDPKTSVDERLSAARVTSMKLIRHKPNKRCLLAITFASDYDTGSKDELADRVEMEVLGKVRFRGLDHRSATVQAELYEVGFRPPNQVRVPKVLGKIERANMWLQERVKATTLCLDSGFTSETHYRIGEALANIHQCDISTGRQFTVANEMDHLRLRLEETKRMIPTHASMIDQVIANANQCAQSVSSRNLTFVHRDFYFDQVLTNDDDIVLVDWDLATQSAPELDVANYVAHLIELGMRRPEVANNCSRAEEQFLLGYQSGSKAFELDDYQHWLYLSLARHIWLSTRFPDRAHTREALFEWCASRSGFLSSKI